MIEVRCLVYDDIWNTLKTQVCLVYTIGLKWSYCILILDKNLSIQEHASQLEIFYARVVGPTV